MLTSDYERAVEDVFIRDKRIYTRNILRIAKTATRQWDNIHPVTGREKVKIVLHSGTVIICG